MNENLIFGLFMFFIGIGWGYVIRGIRDMLREAKRQDSERSAR